jgi:hypothetical protein
MITRRGDCAPRCAPPTRRPEFPIGQNPFGGRQTKIELFVVRVSANRGAQHFDLVARRARLGNARAAVNDDRMVDMLLRQDDVGLEIFDFQPRSANVGSAMNSASCSASR